MALERKSATALLAALTLAQACGSGEPQPAGATEAPKTAESARSWPLAVERGKEARHAYDRVVLVTIDTLRADHVHCYGYPRETTPFLDSRAEHGARFTRAIAACSQTAPSHATVLTGLVPAVHGVLENGGKLVPEAVDLAGAFGGAGFETAAFLNVKFLVGIAKSFRMIGVRSVGQDGSILTGADVVDAALAWLDKKPRKRFFLWAHLYDPHKWKDLVLARSDSSAPIWSGTTPDGFLEHVAALHGLPLPQAGESYRVHWDVENEKRSVESLDLASSDGYLRCIDAYDELTLFADRQIERLYHGIEERVPPGRTLWIVTADHGEGLASHGAAGHGGRIYQEQLRVPLLVFASDDSIPPRVIDELVSHVDLFPTLCATFGGAIHSSGAGYDGRSLWPLLDGAREPWAPRAVFSQRRPASDADPEGGDAGPHSEAYALQTAEAKYILHEPGDDEFFDLAADPRELGDPARRSAAAAELRVELERRLETYRSMAPARGEVVVPEEWQEELRKLGYAR